MTQITLRSDIPVELVSHMGTDLDVARSAWVSTQGERSEDEQDKDRIAGLISFLMKGRHGSPFEQCVMRWRVRAPIFVWREHHRHRIASYNEESGRYSKLKPEFYVPDTERNIVQEGKPGAYTFVLGSKAQYDGVVEGIREANHEAYFQYERMLDGGVAKEVARMCLPVNIYSTCYVTMNLRALMNFLSLRTKDEDSFFPSYPQREIEMVAERYEEGFAHNFPLVYEAFHSNGRVAP
jgi:thymidylate synthase (FAD)